jgi:hypothetical protein
MSICVTESLQSRRMLDELSAYQARQEKLEADMAFDFVRSIEAGDPDATPAWAGTAPDYEAGRALGMPYGAKGFPRRAYTVAECLQDALDYAKGPSLVDVVKVLSLAMRGSDPTVALAARQLVERAAAKWAEQNAEVGE